MDCCERWGAPSFTPLWERQSKACAGVQRPAPAASRGQPVPSLGPPSSLQALPVGFFRQDDPLGVESSIYPSSQGQGPFPENLQLASAGAGPGEGIQGGRVPLNSQVGLWGRHTPSLLWLHRAPSCHSSVTCHLALPSCSELLVGPIHM